MKTKYLKNTLGNTWIRKSQFYYANTPVIWSSMMKVIHQLKKGISWNIGNGKNILIGIDPFIGDNGCPYLPTDFIEHLAWIDMRTMDVMMRSKWAILKGGYWLNARDPGLSGKWAVKWDFYIEIMKKTP